MMDQPGFGDRVTTVDKKGKRQWIYALQPKGKFYAIRNWISAGYLVLFFTIPFIRINGSPFFLFNIVEARFIFFGKIFLPQDFMLMGIGMLTFLVFIIVFTLIFGRVFCGWACPQTIFLEMVFRRIEFWIEGNANKQKIADKSNWSTELYVRKVIKHVIFFALSFLIANTFLAYIIGTQELFAIIREPVADHVGGFIALLVFTIAFYAVYAFVREIVCTVICPYGRLQSVLLDKQSIVVSYDHLRGEPRSKQRNDLSKGDCIDCGLCVQVCPTGIDIRNGTQMECINCTACIDACNLMMTAVNRPPDLVKYASEKNITERKRSVITYRVKIYSVVLVLLIGILTLLLVTRPLFDATVLRVPGQTLQENKDGTVSNLYRIKIVNKNYQTRPYHLMLADENAKLTFLGKQLDSLKPIKEVEEVFFITVPKEKIMQRKDFYELRIMSDKEIIQTKKIAFIGEY